MTRKILKTLNPVFLAAGAWLLLSMQAHAGDYTALGCPLAIDAGPLRCEAGADRDTRMRDRLAQLQAEGRLKPMPRPRSQPAPLAKSASRLQREGHPRPEDPEAGLVPADYINPIDLVREQGHLRHEVHVDIPRDWSSDRTRLVQALSFQAPDWARKMLVEFIPDEPLDKQGPAGLYLRPHNPFVEGSFPQTEGPFDRYPIDVHAINQAAYRSEHNSQYGVRHYILVTRDMDPAPAGKSWHVAIGQLKTWSISGTVRVYFSGSTYRPPLAVRLYYDAEEEAQQVGFFDPTPREPDGDNPGTTQGEAMRWILFQATEELLDHLDFDGFLPIRILATTFEDNLRGAGFASSWIDYGFIEPETPAPGRLRARGPNSGPLGGGFTKHTRHFYSVPLTVWEREAGTDACRARSGGKPIGLCGSVQQPNEALITDPGQVSAVTGYISILRDFERTSGSRAGTWWRWDKNLKDWSKPRRPNITALIKHEMMHVLGFSWPTKSQAYLASFEPPRPWLDRPYDILAQRDGEWFRTGTRQHFYGPIASPSEHNPWRHTAEPGPRLDDPTNSTNANLFSFHLMNEDGDELAQWEPRKDLMRPWIVVNAPQEEVGIERDILLDLGYARGTWSIQDRRLPRHWYDPERSGHGLDFRRVERADGSMQHFLHFYTYDSDGNPEWYIATGELDDRMVLEAGLDYVTWDEGRHPKAQVDPGRSGTVRLNLDPAIDHPACAERRQYHPDGNSKWLFAVLEFDLPDGSGTWCLEPLMFGREPAFPEEGSGSWYAADPEDSGWGLSVMTRNYGPRPIINTVVYYYDDAGEPTWSIGTAGADYTLPYGSVGAGIEIDMLHVTGFCRTCEPVATTTTPAGAMRISISSQDADDPGNRIERLDVTDQGPVGGSWFRENVEIHLLSSPHPNMSQ